MHKLKATITATLYDQHGNLIRKYRPRAANSFLAHFIELLHLHLSQIQTTIHRVDGTPALMTVTDTNFRINTGASTLTSGMLIGSGNTPVDIDDHKLQTPISADLTVSAHTFVLSYPTPTSRRVAISRTFTNASVSPMPIEEVAIYGNDVFGHVVCFDRTLYSVGIPALSSLELTYRVDVSV